MRFMAYFNLLAGNCIGTLGATYSARSKSGNVLKARPFSKSPSSTTQKNCVRAFSALNRISSKLSKSSWNLLGLSDEKMLKHNAVANLLKPCIQNHAFEPLLISQAIPASGLIAYSSVLLNPSLQNGTFDFSFNSGLPLQEDESLIFEVFNEKGVVFFCNHTKLSTGTINFNGLFPPLSFVYLMGFRSTVIRGKRKLLDLHIETIEVLSY
jgi:hypothetical protein